MTSEDTDCLGMKPGGVDAIQELGEWPMRKICNELKKSTVQFQNDKIVIQS